MPGADLRSRPSGAACGPVVGNRKSGGDNQETEPDLDRGGRTAAIPKPWPTRSRSSATRTRRNSPVINIGGTYVTGPEEGAYVINELVQPNAVISSHVNEDATRDGQPLEGTRTATFVKAVNVPVHIPLSGRTMAFDDRGSCVEGC